MENNTDLYVAKLLKKLRYDTKELEELNQRIRSEQLKIAELKLTLSNENRDRDQKNCDIVVLREEKKKWKETLLARNDGLLNQKCASDVRSVADDGCIREIIRLTKETMDAKEKITEMKTRLKVMDEEEFEISMKTDKMKESWDNSFKKYQEMRCSHETVVKEAQSGINEWKRTLHHWELRENFLARQLGKNEILNGELRAAKEKTKLHSNPKRDDDILRNIETTFEMEEQKWENITRKFENDHLSFLIKGKESNARLLDSLKTS